MRFPITTRECRGNVTSYSPPMNDFLETPVGDFEWGPQNRLLSRLRDHLPAVAIGAGLVLTLAGLVWLVQG